MNSHQDNSIYFINSSPEKTLRTSRYINYSKDKLSKTFANKTNPLINYNLNSVKNNYSLSKTSGNDGESTTFKKHKNNENDFKSILTNNAGKFSEFKFDIPKIKIKSTRSPIKLIDNEIRINSQFIWNFYSKTEIRKENLRKPNKRILNEKNSSEYNLLFYSKRRKLSKSSKEYYNKEIPFYNTSEPEYFRIFYDNDIGFNSKWQGLIHELKNDEDVASDDDLIEKARIYLLDELKNAFELVKNEQASVENIKMLN
jgi:hypothetical protein